MLSAGFLLFQLEAGELSNQSLWYILFHPGLILYLTQEPFLLQVTSWPQWKKLIIQPRPCSFYKSLVLMKMLIA